MDIVIKVALLLVILFFAAWGLQKLFPPTEKDIEKAKKAQERAESKINSSRFDL